MVKSQTSSLLVNQARNVAELELQTFEHDELGQDYYRCVGVLECCFPNTPDMSRSASGIRAGEQEPVPRRVPRGEQPVAARDGPGGTEERRVGGIRQDQWQ